MYILNAKHWLDHCDILYIYMWLLIKKKNRQAFILDIAINTKNYFSQKKKAKYPYLYCSVHYQSSYINC